MGFTERGIVESEEPGFLRLSFFDELGVRHAFSTADCLPIFLADPRRRVIGAVHAGWRSSVQRIVERALRKMHEAYGTDPAECYAALGPGIRGCCYEVDEPVITKLKGACTAWQGCVKPIGEGRRMMSVIALL